MGLYIKNATVKMSENMLVSVKDPDNKAPVELLTQPQMQLRYRTSNWANNAMFSCYWIVISANRMGPCLKNATVNMSKIVLVPVKDPGNKAPEELLTQPQRQLRYSASNWANNATYPIALS